MTSKGPIAADALDLRNLWALDAADNLTPAHRCVVGVAYRCPRADCGSEMRVRAAESERVRAHLYHVDPCRATESTDHALAKQIVARAISNWLDDPVRSLAPSFVIGCDEHPKFMQEIVILLGVDAVLIEGEIGRRRADVLLGRGQAPPIAVEIFHSHAVDEEKAADLAEMRVPWVELSARQVISARVPRWRAVRGSVSLDCPLCVAQAALGAAEAVAADASNLRALAREDARRAATLSADAKRAIEEAERAIAAARPMCTAAGALAEAERLANDAIAAYQEAQAANRTRLSGLESMLQASQHRIRTQIAESQKAAAALTEQARLAEERLRKAILVDETAVLLLYARSRTPRQIGELVSGDRPSEGDVEAFATWRDAAVQRERRAGEDAALAALRLEAARKLELAIQQRATQHQEPAGETA